MVTVPCSTITGTLRFPFECFSISAMRPGFATTLTYSTLTPFFWNASRASVV